MHEEGRWGGGNTKRAGSHRMPIAHESNITGHLNAMIAHCAAVASHYIHILLYVVYADTVLIKLLK